MIIFNLYAILVAFFIALGALPILALQYFNLIDEHLSMVLVAWEALVVSALSQMAGVKGRLFFLPMWVLALPLAFLVTYAFYDWTGIVAVVGPVVALVGFVLFMLYRSERKRADGILYESYDLPYDEADPLAFWKSLKEKLFFPTFLGLNEQICDFNARLAQQAELHPSSMASLSAFRTEMEEHARLFDKKRLNKTLIEEFTNELDAKIEAMEKHQGLQEARA